MADIKPIETIYNGYRFRSRLEARWAVFFDAAGIKYEYELEGYQLHDGTLYLPDFFLPEFNIFVEIKVSREKDDEKACRFSEDYCNFGAYNNDGSCGYGGILVCYGDPYADDLRFISYCESDDSGGGGFDADWYGYGITHFLFDTSEMCAFLYIDVRKLEMNFDNADRVFAEYYKPKHTNDFAIKVAATKARQARFEHGERGGRNSTC